MADESQLLLAMFQKVKAVGLPAAYPGSKFDPPDSGQWLELIYLPNDDLNSPVNANSTRIQRGMFRVNVCGRQNTGLIPLSNAAETVRDAFPLASVISGSVRVSKWPQTKDLGADDGVMRLAVTVEYAG